MNFTASHNPPEYQGIKFSTADGAPALPEITKQIEDAVAARSIVEDEPDGSIEEFDPRPAYLDDLKTKVRFDVMATAKGRYAYDALWGTGRGYLDKVLRDNGLEVETVHDWRDVTFGGQAPEPGEEHLGELRAKVKSNDFTLGIATDGDSDMLFGKMLRKLPAGTAYKVPPTGITAHANINISGKTTGFIYMVK